MYYQFVKISSYRIKRFLLYSRPSYVFNIVNYNSIAYVVIYRSRYYVILRSKSSVYYYRLSTFFASSFASTSHGLTINKHSIKQMIITLLRYVNE